MEEKRKNNSTKSVLIPLLVFLFLTVLVVVYGHRGDTELEVSSPLFDFKLKLTRNLPYEGSGYRAEMTIEKEVIKGRSGDYIKVNLFNEQSGQPFFFREEEFQFDTFEKDFLRSWNYFRSEILNPLIADGYQIELYIQGSADISGDKTFEKSMPEMISDISSFKEIEYLPKIGLGNIYSSTAEVMHVSKTYSNRELPNLRSAYLKRIIVENDVPISGVYILQGKVVPYEGEEYMNATLYLFIDEGFN